MRRVLAAEQFGLQQALGPQPGAHVLHRIRPLRPTLAEHIAHTVQHGDDRRKVRLFVLALNRFFEGAHIGLGGQLGLQSRVGQQGVGQGL